MVVKISDMKNASKSSFKRLIKYLTEDKSSENIRDYHHWIEPHQLYDDNDMKQFIENVSYCQSLNNSKSDKTYHMVVSFPQNERPDLETLKKISDELVKSIGYEDHQRMTVLHDDTDNLHMHLAINKVNHISYNIHEPYYPYKTLSKKAEELEIRYNLERTHDSKTPKEKDYSKSNDIDSRNEYLESFKSYVQNIDLSQSLSWSDFHDTLRENGVEYQKYGSGAVFKDLVNDKVSIKASAVNREYTLSKLESRFGEFQESKSTKKILRSYQRIKDKSLYEQYKESDIARQIKIKDEKDAINKEFQEKFQDKSIMTEISDNVELLASTVQAQNSALDDMTIALAKYIKRKTKKKIDKEEKKEKLQKVNNENKKVYYEQWLALKAQYDDRASKALKTITDNKLNYIGGDFKELHKDAIKITKNGTYILNNKIRANKDAIFLDVRSERNIKKALKLITDNKISITKLNGSEEFQEKLINIIAKNNIDISFPDNSINEKILAAKILNNENFQNYINQSNKKINDFEIFDTNDKDYIYQGFEKYNGKFFIKLKSTDENLIFIKEPVQADYELLKGKKKGEIVRINSEIKNSYELEQNVKDKKDNRIVFKELTESEYDKSFKRVSTKDHNGTKIYLYKKENDKSVYVSKTVLREQQIDKEKSKSKKEIER